MNTTKIISAIYFDLYGTILGGRPGRNDHYLYSLNSIMNINNAHFIVYTNDKNKVDTFYQNTYPDKMHKFTSIEYDLHNTSYSSLINKNKNIDSTKTSDRCIELQYSKFTWLSENNNNCDFIYWIDAGLCYTGLLPNKYLKTHTGRYYDSYYGSDLFTDQWLNNISTTTADSILVCAKDNVRNYWDGSVPSKYFVNEYCSIRHVIGGLFGGCSKKVKILTEKFNLLATDILYNESHLYSEEQILTCLFYNYPSIFSAEFFDIWWHEDNAGGALDIDDANNLLRNNKSFYKIIEKFI